jgi:hypothetical protein
MCVNYSVPSLAGLKNEELRTRFESLRQRESEVLADLVLHLSEIDSRGYYRDLGYSSMFSYLTQGLKYSEGAAQRRILAARCLRGHPEVYEKLRNGSLSLSAIGEIVKVKAEEQARLLVAAVGRSKREVERLVAEVMPPIAAQARETVRVKMVSVAAPGALFLSAPLPSSMSEARPTELPLSAAGEVAAPSAAIRTAATAASGGSRAVLDHSRSR